MSEKLEISHKPVFDNSINNIDERIYQPQNQTFKKNDAIEIEVKQEDGYICMADSYLYIEGELIPNAAGTGTCKLSNNAPMFLFDSISYEFNGMEVEKVRDPGITTTIHGLIAYTKAACTSLMLAGWNPLPTSGSTILTTDNDEKKFWFKIPLDHIFGIFRHYKHIMLGRHKLRFIRSRTDANCYITTAAQGALGDKEATISIYTISLHVQHIFPNIQNKLALLKHIASDQSVLIGFHEWEIHELPALTAGNTKKSWSITTSVGMKRPRYIILAFQTDIKDKITKDVTKFNSIDLIKYCAWIGSKSYPYNPALINFTDNQYINPYQSYVNLARELCGGISDPIIDYHTFESRALFVVDCSKQEEALQEVVLDVKVDFETRIGFPANTRAYCIIVHDKVVEYTTHTHQIYERI